MKIALIRQRYTPYGGAERFVAMALDTLKKQGADITLFTRKWPSDAGGAAVCNPFYLGSTWRDAGFARAVCRQLSRASFDLVQSHERLECCDIFRAGDGVHREWLAQRARYETRRARWVTQLNPYHRYVLAAERRMFSSSRLKAVICNSRMVKEEITAHFELPNDKLHVIYNGVDRARFHPDHRQTSGRALRLQEHVSANTVVYLFVGSGFARKGLRPLLHAFARLQADALLWVVGHDKKIAHYRKLAATLGIANRVRFFEAQRDVSPFYAAADGFVLPTYYDPFPNSVLEAMASGLPVITSCKSGASDVIVEGQNGFVCDAFDDAALAARMFGLIDAEVRRRVGQAARETTARFTYEAMGEALLQLYERLLALDHAA